MYSHSKWQLCFSTFPLLQTLLQKKICTRKSVNMYEIILKGLQLAWRMTDLEYMHFSFS